MTLATIAQMPRGTRVIYHTGLLYADRGIGPDAAKAEKAINTAANLAWDLHLAGLVNLVQRRVFEGGFEYIAERTSKHAVPRGGSIHG